MKHVHRRLAAKTIALVLTCAAVASAPARAQTDEQILRRLDSAWIAAFTARDTVKLASFYASEAVGMFPNMVVATGANAIRSGYAQMVRLPNAKMVAMPRSVLVSKGGDLATMRGTYRFTYDGPEGPVADRPSPMTR
jgi:ketosteroid isomerase-like protein